MARALDVSIGIKHGDACTCTPLDPIAASVQPVLITRDCPAQRELPRDEAIVGRVIITWPAAKSDRPHAPIPVWGVSITDADSGEQLVDVVGLRMVLGAARGWEGIVMADLEQLTDADRKPLGNRPVAPSADDEFLPTAVFRYAVAEMRVAASEAG